MGREFPDFVVDMNSHCFLCLEEITYQCPSAGSSTHSLQYLSRYLKMNLAKVFHKKGPIPRQLLAKMETARFKVTLCEGCTCLVERFSELYRQLEKTEMEVNACLEVIHGKMFEANELGRTDKFYHNLDLDDVHNEEVDNFEIVEVLRKEAMQKCSRKLRIVSPMVRIYKAPSSNNCKKIKSTVREADTMIELVPAKVEQPEEDLIDWNNYDTEYAEQSSPALEESLEVKYSCQFNNERSHKGRHLQNKFECETCGEKFTNHQSYSKHLRTFHRKIVIGGRKRTNVPKAKNGPNRETASSLKSSREIEKPWATSSKKRGISVNDTSIMVQVFQKNVHNWEKNYSFISETKSFKCNDCPREFKRKPSFCRHYSGVHLKARYKCIQCGAKFTRKDNCYYHHEIVHMGRGVRCGKCRKFFRFEEELKDHQNSSASCKGPWSKR